MNKTEILGKLTPSQRAMYRCLDSLLFGGELIPPEDGNWSGLLAEAKQHNVLLQVYHAADGLLPPEIRAAYRQEYWRQQYAVLRVTGLHHEMHLLLTQAGIPYVVLKGCVSSSYYPQPELRALGDVDLLIRRENRERVHALMLGEGYALDPESEGHQHHWCYKKDGFTVEVHWEPSGVPAVGGEKVRVYTDPIVDTGREVPALGLAMRMPSPFSHGVVLLLHTAAHFTSTGIGVRQLLDWICFRQSMTEGEFLDLFEKPLRSMGLWEFTRVLTSAGAALFTPECPAFCRDVDPKLVEAILLDVFKSGNMGKRNAARINEAKFLRDEQSRRAGGHPLSNLFGFLTLRAKQRYPGLEKRPYLLPAGWAAVSVRYLADVRRGKRAGLNLLGTAKGMKTHSKLYRELKLFEES